MQTILSEIQGYQPWDEEDATFKDRFFDLLSIQKDRAFYRDCFVPGHITGSALLMSHDGSRILMNHHKSLNKWLCFGGHADGDQDILNVAFRECVEESGIENVEPVYTQMIDLDIHLIPENPRKGEPPHCHFDLRYLFRCTGHEAFKLSHESLGLQWCTFQEALELASDDSMKRLIRKALASDYAAERLKA